MFRLDSCWLRSSNIQLFQWNSVLTMLDSSSSSDVSSPVVPLAMQKFTLRDVPTLTDSNSSSGVPSPVIPVAMAIRLFYTAWRSHCALQRLQWPVSVFVPHSRCSQTLCRVETPPLLLQSRCREGCYHDNRRDVTSALRKQRIILTGPSQLTHTPVCRLQHSTSIVCQVNKHRLHWLSTNSFCWLSFTLAFNVQEIRAVGNIVREPTRDVFNQHDTSDP